MMPQQPRPDKAGRPRLELIRHLPEGNRTDGEARYQSPRWCCS
jgi:hypothetical protein